MKRGGGTALELVAAVIATIFRIAAFLIVLAIIFVVLEANEQNGIVSFILDVGDFLVGPFDGLFTPEDRKVEVAINYGIAAVVYLIVGQLIAGLVRRAGGSRT